MNYKYVVFSLFILLFITGCPLRDKVILYNNSNEPISVIAETVSLEVPVNNRITISDSGADITWENLYWNSDKSQGGFYPIVILLDSNHLKRSYTLLFSNNLPDNYDKKIKGTRIRHLQYNNDGSLTAVPVEKSFPVTDPDLNIPLEKYIFK